MNDIVQDFLSGSGWSQTNRQLALHTRQGAEVLVAESAQICEEVGPAPETAGFAIELTALSSDANLPIVDWLGQPMRLDLLTAHSRVLARPFHGHVTHASRLAANGGFARYALRIDPWLSFLGLRRDSYIFQDKSVIEIAEEIFGD